MKTVIWSAVLAPVLTASTLIAADRNSKPLTLPAAPQPIHVVARLNKLGQLEVDRMVTTMRAETRTRVRKKNGQKVEETYMKYIPEQTRVTALFRLSDVIIYRGQIEALDPEDIRDEFDKPKAVIMSANGKRLDPFFFKSLRPNVLTIVKKKRDAPAKKAK